MDEISISSVSPFPPLPSLTCVASNGSLMVSWPPAYLGWILQAQTNALSVGLTPTWAGVDLAGTDLVTSTNIPINLDPSMVSFRLRHP